MERVGVAPGAGVGDAEGAMNSRVPLGFSLVCLLLACVFGWHLGVKIAGPMPEIVRTPEPPERNYTLETLRALNPPPTTTMQPHYRTGPEFYQGWAIASESFYNIHDVRQQPTSAPSAPSPASPFPSAR